MSKTSRMVTDENWWHSVNALPSDLNAISFAKACFGGEYFTGNTDGFLHSLLSNKTKLARLVEQAKSSSISSVEELKMLVEKEVIEILDKDLLYLGLENFILEMKKLFHLDLSYIRTSTNNWDTSVLDSQNSPMITHFNPRALKRNPSTNLVTVPLFCKECMQNRTFGVVAELTLVQKEQACSQAVLKNTWIISMKSAPPNTLAGLLIFLEAIIIGMTGTMQY
jgi:hypothetical protein